MKTHAQMQHDTLMENPLVALMTRDDQAGRNAWRTVYVFIDDDEAEEFLKPQRHRYPEDKKETHWKLYAIPCSGILATIVKQARNAAEADASHEGMELEVAEPVAVIGSGGRVAVPTTDAPPADPFDKQPDAPATGENPIPEFSADDRGNVVDFYDADGEKAGIIDREAEVNGVPDQKTFEAFHSGEALEAWMRANGYGEELDEIRAAQPKAEPEEDDTEVN